MKNTYLLAIILSVIAMSSIVFAGFGSTILIKASADPKLDYFYWINATDNTIVTEESFQKYLISWENIGSLSCRAKFGLYIFKGNNTNLSVFDNVKDLEYVAWSKDYEAAAGSTITTELTSPLPEGEYKGDLRVYYCNEFLRFGPYNISVKKSNGFDNSTIKINSVSYSDKYIEIKAISDKRLDKLYVYPLSYPFGWVLEQNVTDNIEANKEQTIKIGYERPVKQETTVRLRLASDNYITDTEVLIKEKEDFDIRYVIIPILIIVFLIGLYALYKLKDKKRH
ncbi:MAG: hypothetical protein HY831_03625 [Candidatus Aenigmarchaeota archaeon]|nr:hypothetical protein [Candidatus Aenigmarchaeota archaeon]